MRALRRTSVATLTRYSVLTGTKQQAEISRETLPTEPGVEITQVVLQAVVLTLNFSLNSNYYINSIIVSFKTSSLSATLYTIDWSTNTLLTASLVVSAGVKETVEL